MEKFLRITAVEEAIGAKRAWIYAQIAKGKFPKPVKIFGPKTSAWLASEIAAWQAERIRERDEALQRTSSANDAQFA